MAAVTVRSQEDGRDGGTLITLDNFRAWKRKSGRYTAFVVQAAGSEDEFLVCTFADMNQLPHREYQGQLVKKCAMPGGARKALRGTDLWKIV